MGKQLSFTEENVKKNPFDYPKLKLAKGETARLTYVEDPYSEYVHSIQKPVLDERNNVLYRTVEGKNGSEYTVPKLTWVSSPICLGDTDVLDSEGIDPENCPVCAKAAAGEKGFYPKRRFAMHVIRTNVRPGGFEPVEPYSGQLIIWAFTDTIFNKLFAFQKKWGLDTHDLELGPCTDADFQKADLNVSSDTAVDAKTRKAIFDEKNRSEDPTVFCGSRKSRQRIEEDLALVDEQWAKANKEETGGSSLSTAKSLNEGIGALLDGDSESVPTVKADVKTSPDPVDSFDALPETKKESPKPSPAKDDLDSILDNL